MRPSAAQTADAAITALLEGAIAAATAERSPRAGASTELAKTNASAAHTRISTGTRCCLHTGGGTYVRGVRASGIGLEAGLRADFGAGVVD